jgi:hypothetical protein
MGKGIRSQEQMDELYKKLAIQTLSAQWIDLGFHLENGNVFLIDSSLDIVTVAHAIASDQTRVIDAWIQCGMIKRVADKTQYEKDTIMRTLIVQPFVLVQSID